MCRFLAIAQWLMIMAAGVSLANNPPDPRAKKDLEALQGTWSLVSAMNTVMFDANNIAHLVE